MAKGGARPALIVAVVAAAAGVLPASATTQATPRAGKYSGQEVYDHNPLPVKFSVAKNRRRVVKFTGQAQVKDGCSNYITGFQAPSGPMPITSDGRFAASSTSYPQQNVRVKVTVTGTFTSRLRARGHISVRIAKTKGCNASRPFTVRRVSQ